MKSISLALVGGIALTGAALAQTQPTPPPAPKPPAAAPTPPAPPPTLPAPQANAQGAASAMPTPGGPPEGMIVETPNGFFLVRPGDGAPRRLDLGPNGPGQGGQGMAQSAPQPGDEPMDGAGDDAMQPPPPPPRRGPMPPHPPEGKGARFSIKTPNLTLTMKCPDEEPIRACVDAVSQLLDRANAQAH